MGGMGIMRPKACPREYVPTRLLSKAGSQAFGGQGKDTCTGFSSWCSGRGQRPVGPHVGAAPVETSSVNKHSHFPGLHSPPSPQAVCCSPRTCFVPISPLERMLRAHRFSQGCRSRQNLRLPEPESPGVTLSGLVSPVLCPLKISDGALPVGLGKESVTTETVCAQI